MVTAGGGMLLRGGTWAGGSVPLISGLIAGECLASKARSVGTMNKL